MAIIVVSGPSGVGKGEIVKRVLREIPELVLNRSWTTRARREGDPPDAYHFVTRQEFLAHAENGGFLEWAEYSGNLYGSPVPSPAPGEQIMLEIEVQGARQVEADLKIFISPPGDTWEEKRDCLMSRQLGRGDQDGDSMQKRLATARDELVAAREFDHQVVNDDLDQAVATVVALIRAAIN